MAPDGGQYPMWGNSSTELSKLSKKPLDQYLTRLMPQVVAQYDKMKRKREVLTYQFHTEIKVSVTTTDVYVNTDQTSESLNISTEKEDNSPVQPQNRQVIPKPSESLNNSTEKDYYADQPQSKQVIPKPTQDEFSYQVQKAEFQNTQQALMTLSQVEVFNQKFLEFIDMRLKDCAFLKSSKLVTQLSKLKAAVISYVHFIDQILLHYTLLSYANNILPVFERVNKSKSNIQSIMKKMNPEELEKLLPQAELSVTKDNFLSAILGLDEKVTKYLTGLAVEDRLHEPDQYYITNYLHESVDSVDFASHERIIEACTNCGFTESRAHIFALWLDNRFDANHQPLSYWIDLYIDNLFKYNILLSNECARYPYDETIIDKWYSAILPANEDSSAEQSSVKVFNSSERSKLLTKDEIKYPGEKELSGYWYHGTDHDSACNIIEEGIQLRYGNQRQDFSDANGFYVSPTFSSAKNWALNKTKSAVLIFNVEKAVEEFDGMDMMKNQKNEWSAVVKYNRCGRIRACPLSGELRKRYNICDYIVGPRSGDGAQGTKCYSSNCAAWQPSGYDSNKSARQLCIRSDKMAEEFSRKMERVIFY